MIEWINNLSIQYAWLIFAWGLIGNIMYVITQKKYNKKTKYANFLLNTMTSDSKEWKKRMDEANKELLDLKNK